ncbi:MAG: hypothetical protein GY865_01575 [candidate division Zixibacteria bacterium]|nr:hypothetical protein [candidate division Zixibacteria bacterium]
MWKRYILPLLLICIIAMITTLFGFALIVDAGEKYKCLAELYPELTEKNGIQKIGGTYTSEKGDKYRVIAECKKIEEDVWLQFIDTDALSIDKLDNKVDFVMQLFLKDGQLWIGNIFSSEDFEAIGAYLNTYCEKHNIKIEDYIHVAPGVLKKIVPDVNNRL